MTNKSELPSKPSVAIRPDDSNESLSILHNRISGRRPETTDESRPGPEKERPSRFGYLEL